MPRVVDSVVRGQEIILADGTPGRVEATVGSTQARVRHADGSETIEDLVNLGERPSRGDRSAAAAKVATLRPGYKRTRIRYWDESTRRVLVFVSSDDSEATAFAQGKTLFGDAAATEAVEP